jgi:hypothetical protein
VGRMPAAGARRRSPGAKERSDRGAVQKAGALLCRDDAAPAARRRRSEERLAAAGSGQPRTTSSASRPGLSTPPRRRKPARPNSTDVGLASASPAKHHARGQCASRPSRTGCRNDC